MKLLTRKAPPATPATFSADALALAIGRTTDEIVQRFGAAGADLLGRPVIAYADAVIAHAEYQAADARSDQIRWAWLRWLDERGARRLETAAAAAAEVRAGYTLARRGGEEWERYQAAQHQAEMKALEAFDLAEPPQTITEWRSTHV